MGQSLIIDTAELEWLANQGAAFALPWGRTKNKFETGWPNRPHTLSEAITHAQRGGNVGILTGKHSNNIIALDRDVQFGGTIEMLGAAAQTAKVVRDNAPDRGKLLYRVVGELPPTSSWRPEGEKHPHAELLANGRHALGPTSTFDGGRYVLRDIDLGILEVTPAQLNYIWFMITDEHLYRQYQSKEGNHADQSVREYIDKVKEQWTTIDVFKYFNKHTEGIVEKPGRIHIRGNGGLVVNDWRWFCHADNVGGDQIDAWYWCKTGKALDRGDRRGFWDTVNEMAEVAGVNLLRVHTNGHSNKTARRTIDPATGEIVEHDEIWAEEPPQATQSSENVVDVLKYRAEDGGILDAWVEHYSDKWIFATGSDCWHYWDGTCWQIDDCLTIQREIRELLDAINRQCSQLIKETPDQIAKLVKSFAGVDMPDSTAKQIESLKTGMEIAETMRKASKRTKSRISSIEGMAQSVNAKPVSAFNICDSINLSNGTLNLHSLNLQPHNRDDLFTYRLDYEYNPEAKCPLFERFIGEVLVKEGTIDTDRELVNLFQELLGYSLTTQTKRQVMIWIYGDGGNGKSVAVDIIQALLGPMATTVDFQSIGMPGNYDLADIPGKRVVFSTEAEKGGAVSEKYIKCIVSGDPLTARPIYGSPIKFQSTAKIWWAMNDRPVVKDTSDSMWRRMKLIPFLRKFEEGKNADVDLPQKLKAELPGILNWAIQGLIRLTLNDHFTHSGAAEAAKSQYREESNPVARWVNTMTVRTDYPTTLQGALFDHFKSWLSSENEKAITSNQFGRDLGRLKIPKTRRDKGFMYHLALIQN